MLRVLVGVFSRGHAACDHLSAGDHDGALAVGNQNQRAVGDGVVVRAVVGAAAPDPLEAPDHQGLLRQSVADKELLPLDVHGAADGGGYGAKNTHE